MKTLDIVVASSLIVVMSTPAFAGDLRAAAAKVASEEQTSSQQTAPARNEPIPKGYLLLGSGLFVGGMSAAMIGFLNNSNGSFPEFGEATSTNVKMGAAGLATAFAGGAVLFLGKRKANSSASVTFGPGRLTVSKRLTW